MPDALTHVEPRAWCPAWQAKLRATDVDALVAQAWAPFEGLKRDAPADDMVISPRMAFEWALMTAIVAASDPKHYDKVGQVRLRCPIAIDADASFRTRPTWTVTPAQAVEAAGKSGDARCNSKFAQDVVADDENYYIVKPFGGEMSLFARAVVIDGKTGKVSIQNP